MRLVQRIFPMVINRRTFLMRTALIVATTLFTVRHVSDHERAGRSKEGHLPIPPLSPALNVVKQKKGPLMTTVDELDEVEPGPSRSHAIGPTRGISDFYERCTKLPAARPAKANWTRGSFVRPLPRRQELGLL